MKPWLDWGRATDPLFFIPHGIEGIELVCILYTRCCSLGECSWQLAFCVNKNETMEANNQGSFSAVLQGLATIFMSTIVATHGLKEQVALYFCLFLVEVLEAVHLEQNDLHIVFKISINIDGLNTSLSSFSDRLSVSLTVTLSVSETNVRPGLIAFIYESVII